GPHGSSGGGTLGPCRHPVDSDRGGRRTWAHEISARFSEPPPSALVSVVGNCDSPGSGWPGDTPWNGYRPFGNACTTEALYKGHVTTSRRSCLTRSYRVRPFREPGCRTPTVTS